MAAIMNTTTATNSTSVFENTAQHVYEDGNSVDLTAADDEELAKRQMLDDLQLAAELGNTLLERNKELEKSLRQHQNIIEDQAQEIEYLNKQTAALKEVNDSRLRIYEQLEVSIQDLERANHRLAVENSNDKKQIKNLLSQIETLEEKCEELQKNLDDVTRQLNLTRRHQQRLTNTTATNNHTLSNNTISTTSAIGEHHNSVTDQNGKLRLRANNKNKLENGTAYQDGDLQMSQENTMECDSSNLDMMTIDEDDDEHTRTTVDEVDHNSATSTTNTLRYYNNNTNTRLQDINLINNTSTAEYSDEIIQLLKELADERAQRTRDQRRVTELEEQMTSLLHQIQALEQQLAEYHQKEVMTSMQEEISTLEEVRDGHLCAHCLRNIDEHARDELSALLDQESVVYEDDHTLESANDSIINEMPYKSTISLEIQDSENSSNVAESTHENDKTNPYRVLVEKYEALLEVKRQPLNKRRNPPPMKSLSLQEELQMSGDFNSLSTKDTDDESGHGGEHKTLNTTVRRQKDRKVFSGTPTDFSEAETSSSGFSDETSNKATQTDSLRPGSFLCTIADGEDCKFSIYDDASPIDSRFRNHPEYRELFKEIFLVLKKAAENKDEGEQLPLLDDAVQINSTVPKVPPVTPSTEDIPSDFTDDCQSVTSYTTSELSTTLVESPPETTVVSSDNSVEEKRPKLPANEQKPQRQKQKQKHHHQKQQEQKQQFKLHLETPTDAKPQDNQPVESDTNNTQQKSNEIVLTPYKREPLDYLPGMQLRKKSSSRKNGLRKQADRSESPVLPLSPKILYSTRLSNLPLTTRSSSTATTGGSSVGGKRRDYKPLETPTRALGETSPVWNGNSLQFWSSHGRSIASSPSQYPEFQPSTASQDLIKLKKLDVTYAEALRNADKKKMARSGNTRRK